MEKLTGVLLPIFSLPGPHGIGRFNRFAFQWIDKLHDLGFNAWQVCPMGPTGFGNSPYQPLSEFFINPLYIDLENLVERNFLNSSDIASCNFSDTYVDYNKIQAWQFPLLLKAYEGFLAQGRHEAFETFKAQQGEKLRCFCLFCALKNRFQQKPWWEWPEDYRFYHQNCVAEYAKNYQKFVDFFAFEQWCLSEQWHAIHVYANKKNVRIIGDIPLYVGQDSATVWQNRSLFSWDSTEDHPAMVAGVPPDYFSINGQLWGNPLYNWDIHIQTHFDWWNQRIQANLSWFDVIRIDHFRGLYDYWSVPYGSKTAKTGQWLPGPQKEFFKNLEHHWPQMPFILEDLGDLNPHVKAFQSTLNLPGMSVIQFAFEGENNPYLPQNWPPNTVIYTGTHDNNTTRGWYETLSLEQQRHVCDVLQQKHISSDKISETIIAWILKHRTTQHLILPLQDILNLDATTRINTPGTTQNNWQWRCKNFQNFHKTRTFLSSH